MDYITKDYEPRLALQYFEEISAIPRSSGNEAGIAAYLEDFAKAHGLKYRVDKANNVIIWVPATPGFEDKPAVILQGHTDMVCVKLPGVMHDFDKDPLSLEIANGRLKAKGTTLGGDDGTAVAHILAIIEENDFPHPALECVFTSMEEIGLVGASELDMSDLKGQYLLAMDAGMDQENITTVSCAGGYEIILTRKPEWEPVKGEQLTIRIGGLLGGHSALAIDNERGNAIKLMARVLLKAAEESSLQIISFNSGLKMNAIPSEAVAVISVMDAQGVLASIAETAKDISLELAASDPGFTLNCERNESGSRMLTRKCTDDLLKLLFLFPYGVRSRSISLPGTLVISNNIGILSMNDEEITINALIRSTEDSLRDSLGEEFYLLAEKFGFKGKDGAKFSGWKFDPDSKLRKTAMDLYKEMFDKEMEFYTIHGGMEIGVFKGKMPELDIVAFAPICANPHTPEEYVDIESFHNIYRFLKRMLELLTK